MSGLFGTFNIVKRGMAAQQTALTITSHNIANANTDGYSVQRAELKTTLPFGIPSLNSSAEPGQLGTGVEVAKITRARDQFVDYQIRREKSTLGQYSSREEYLSEIETVFMEPSDTGLSTTMGKFWDAWSQVATTPESSPARTILAQNADTLANAIKHNYDQLEKMQTNTGDVVKEQVFEVNSILKQIGDLNVQIKAVVIGGQTPNDLMDKRDLLLDQLSERFSFDITNTDYNGIKINARMADGTSTEILNDSKINIGVSYINKITKDGTDWKAEVYIGGDVNNKTTVTIPNSDISKYADSTTVDSNGVITSMKQHAIYFDSVSSSISGPADFENGSIKGYESVSHEINKFKNQLNNMARTIAIAVNTIHSDSVDVSGSPANKDQLLNFFVSSKENETGAVPYSISEIETMGEPAKYISVNKEILNDPSKINASNTIPGNDGNGDRALLISQLRNTRIDILDINSRTDFSTKTNLNLATLSVSSSQSGTTIDSYFKDTIADLGVSNQEAKRMVTNQDALLNQLQTRRDSLSGVSLDEEMTNMIQFQRAYEANAKMISTIDQLLDVVVNGLLKR